MANGNQTKKKKKRTNQSNPLNRPDLQSRPDQNQNQSSGGGGGSSRPPQREQFGEDRVFRDTESGRITGVRSPSGNVFLAPPRQDLQDELGARIDQEEALKQRVAPTQEEMEKRESREKFAQQEQTFEDAGVFEDQPQRVELDPEGRSIVSGVPILGGLADTLVNTFASATGLQDEEAAQIPDLIQSPEGRRQLMMREIQREELDKAKNAHDVLGVLIEGIPGVGAAAAEYAKRIKQPSETVETLRSNIAEVDSRASSMTDAASQGELGNPTAVIDQLDTYEKDLARLEARIARLVDISPNLRENPEQVDLIEDEILSARQTIFEAKQRAAEGAVVTPSEEQLFFKLMEAKRGSRNI